MKSMEGDSILNAGHVTDARHLPVLMYHHVSNKFGLVILSPGAFRAQMKWLVESDCIPSLRSVKSSMFCDMTSMRRVTESAGYQQVVCMAAMAFYRLSVLRPRKRAEDISARKRAEYLPERTAFSKQLSYRIATHSSHTKDIKKLKKNTDQ